MKRMIKSVVEAGMDTIEDYFDLPDGWDEMSPEAQRKYLTDTAVDHQNNVAPCSAQVVEVED